MYSIEILLQVLAYFYLIISNISLLTLASFSSKLLN